MTETVQTQIEMAAGKAAVAKAIDLGLAAPADRAVVVTTQSVISELIAHARKGLPCVGHDGQPINDLIAEWLEFIAEAIETQRAALTEAGVLFPELPEWVTNVEIELQGADPAWPSGTRMQEGIGPTIPAALADALKGRRKVSIGNGMDDKPDGGY